MPTVVVRAFLRELAGGRSEHLVEATCVRGALDALERQHPALRGFIRDEQGAVRRHLAVFVNGVPADGDDALAPRDRLTVLPSVSGGSDQIELLLGTHKGLVVLRGPRDGDLSIAGRAFAGLEVHHAARHPRMGTYYAACNDAHHGPRVWLADDPLGEWRPSEGPLLPEDAAASVTRVWAIVPGEAEGLVWAGVDPAALFRSEDGGEIWELVRPLWDQPTRERWLPGGGGLMLHSICPWPGEPDRLLVGISVGGVWITDDGGASWRQGNAGISPRYLPDDAEPTFEFCIHHVERSPDPRTLYMQFHGGVYRSDDAGDSWTSIAEGLPSDFGFPIVADPRDPARAWVIPLRADRDRVPPDGRLRAFETSDRGATWTARTDGLPQEGAYQVTLRQAFCHDGGDPLGLWFGTTSGELYGSTDAGASWRRAAANLPPVLSVAAAAA